MARWTNPLTQRRCSGKQRYPDISTAEVRAEQASRKAGELIVAYECPDCSRFHIGHGDLSQRLARQPRSRVCVICSGVVTDERAEQAWEAGIEAECCSPRCQTQVDNERRKKLTNELTRQFMLP